MTYRLQSQPWFQPRMRSISAGYKREKAQTVDSSGAFHPPGRTETQDFPQFRRWNADCNLWLRGDRMFPPRKILFPVDFSARCTAAAKMVETYADHFQAHLTLLHVVAPIMYTDLPIDATSIAEEQLNSNLPDAFQR